MNKWIVAIFIFILALVGFKYLIIFIYCNMKKSIDQKRLEDSETNYENSISSQKGILFQVINNWINGFVRYELIRLGRFPGHIIRRILLKHIYLMDIGKNVVIYGGFEIRYPWNISIEDGSIIGDEAKLDGRNGIKIGKNVNLSTGVWIWTEQHDLQDSEFKDNSEGGSVIIGDRAWVSSRTTILPGLELGEGCVIAAGAVVTKNVSDYIIVAGIPAKEIGERTRDLTYCFDGKYLPFY